MDDQTEQAPAVAPPWYLNQWITDLRQQQKQNQKQNLNQTQKGDLFSFTNTEVTSFLDGAVNIGKTGTNSFIACPRILIDTGALIDNGIAISEDFFKHNLNGDSDRLQTSQLREANGASPNSIMTTLGETDIRVRFSKINLTFSGRAIVFKNLALPIILGMNFLKNNSLSPFLTPNEAKLVHLPSNQSQALIANIVENISGKQTSPPTRSTVNPPQSRSRAKTKQSRSPDNESSPPRLNTPPLSSGIYDRGRWRAHYAHPVNLLCSCACQNCKGS